MISNRFVYDAAPTVVYVGYTPGYAGTVASPVGVVVYRTGYVYPPVVFGTTYVSYPPTYGYGASLAMGGGRICFWLRGGRQFELLVRAPRGLLRPSSTVPGTRRPYATASPRRLAHVNVNATSFYTQWCTAVHATGSYGYNPYTGTSWGSQHANTYNPYTGTSGTVGCSAAYNLYTGNAAASRGGSWYNPYSGEGANASSWADRVGSAQFTGEQRFSGWQSSGGGGWGPGGGGGWGGFRGGGGWRR